MSKKHSDSGPSPGHLSLDEHKVFMEIARLEAEIKATNRPFYQIPTFWTSITPIGIALATLIFTWASGWFDTQRKDIAADTKLMLLEKTNLQVRITVFETERNALSKEVVRIETERKGLVLERTQLTNEVSMIYTQRADLMLQRTFLSNAVQSITQERAELESAKQELKLEAIRNSGFNYGKLQYLRLLDMIQNTRRIMQGIVASESETDATLGALSATLSRLNYGLTNSLPLNRTNDQQLTEWQRNAVEDLTGFHNALSMVRSVQKTNLEAFSKAVQTLETLTNSVSLK